MMEIPKGGVFFYAIHYFYAVKPLDFSNLYPVTSKDPENIILETKKEARASRIPLPSTSTTELNQKEKPTQL